MVLMLLKWSIKSQNPSNLNLNNEDLTKLESQLVLRAEERRTLDHEMVLLQIIVGEVK